MEHKFINIVKTEVYKILFRIIVISYGQTFAQSTLHRYIMRIYKHQPGSTVPKLYIIFTNFIKKIVVMELMLHLKIIMFLEHIFIQCLGIILIRLKNI